MQAAFFFQAHQHKGTAFVDALKAAGAKKVRRMQMADFLLTDFLYAGLFSGTTERGSLRQEAQQAQRLGRPIFLYPHFVQAALPHDLERRPVQTKAFFVPSEGFAEVLRRIDYPTEPEVVGWSLSPVRHFQPFAGQKPKVLFAPLHPVGGQLPDCERDINAHAFELLLLALAAGSIASLTVRHYGDLRANGLHSAQRVEYVPALLNGSTADAERADVVVSAGTYAYMAVALGVPTVFIGQDIRPHNSPRGGGKLAYVRNWELYRELMQFPHSIEMDTDLGAAQETIRNAGRREPATWKQLHIGEPFNAQRFIQRLEAHL